MGKIVFLNLQDLEKHNLKPLATYPLDRNFAVYVKQRLPYHVGQNSGCYSSMGNLFVFLELNSCFGFLWALVKKMLNGRN
jgi:hypothetical protein